MSRADAIARVKLLEARVLGLDPKLSPDPRTLYDEMRSQLMRASNIKAIKSPPYAVAKLLQPRAQDLPREGDIVIDGGTRAEPIVRKDGASFTFGITAHYPKAPGSPYLIAYRFNLEYPTGKVPGFLRYDMNPMLKPDPLPEMRCHVHPGNQDVRVPSPLMHPVEILDLLVYGP